MFGSRAKSANSAYSANHHYLHVSPACSKMKSTARTQHTRKQSTVRSAWTATYVITVSSADCGRCVGSVYITYQRQLMVAAAKN